jgi:hypothetical protein
VPADDARLERARWSVRCRATPAGPAADALKVALAEGQLELDAAGSTLALDAGGSGRRRAAARNAAAAAEKAGAAALVTDLPAAWTLAAADAVKLPVINAGNGADRLRQADCRRNLWHTAPSDRMKRRRAGAGPGHAALAAGAAAGQPRTTADAQQHRAGCRQTLRPEAGGAASPSSCRPTRASATSPTRCC